MRTAALLILLLGLRFISWAQEFEKYVYQIPRQIQAQYAFDPLVEYQSVLNQLDRDANGPEKERFAELVAFGKSEYFESGSIYMGWDKAENYVNEVLKHLLKTNTLVYPDVHVYIVRSAKLNASTLPDGTILLNIGLLAELTDEAALASVLGHELSHYINKDSENRFFDNLKSYNKTNRNNLRIHSEIAHDNQKVEHRCDQFGWEVSYKAGYSIESSMSVLYTLMVGHEIDDSWNRKLETQGSTRVNKLQKLLASHPDIKDRIDSLITYNDKFPKSLTGSKTIVDADGFAYLKYQSRLQVIDMLLHDNLNGFCLKKCVSYLLLEGDDPYIAHYCIEAIRRYIYFEPELFQKPILTDYFPSMPQIESWEDLIVMMLRSPDLIEAALKSPILDKYQKPPSHAILVSRMEEIIKKHNYAEGFLSLALLAKSQQNESQFDRYLNLYLDHPKSIKKDYALNLKNETLYKTLGSTNYFLIDEIDLVEDHYYGLHYRQILSRQMNSEVLAEAQKALRSNDIGNEKIISVSELKREDLNQFLDLKSIMNYASFYEKKFLDANPDQKNKVSDEIIFKKKEEPKNEKGDESKPYEPNYFEYSPEIWNLYEQYKIDHLSIANGQAVDKRDDVRNALLLCCSPFQYLCIRVQGESQRYYFNVSYLTVDTKKPSFDYVSQKIYKKFNPKLYFTELKKLKELLED